MASEKISILFMRDNGTSRRFRMSRAIFRGILLLFFCLCPVLAGLSVWLSHSLWDEKEGLLEQIEALQAMHVQALATAQRLGHLEKLLIIDSDDASQLLSSISKENAQRPILSQPLSAPSGSNTKSNTTPHNDVQDAAQQEGPGHAEFPEINTGEVVVESVNSRLVAPNRLRTAFDIRNPGEDTLSGVVSCILSLANGQTVNLSFLPANAGFYRIQRWKRAVLVSNIDTTFDMMNAQVIIEIHNDDKALVYRNIFPIEQK